VIDGQRFGYAKEGESDLDDELSYLPALDNEEEYEQLGPGKGNPRGQEVIEEHIADHACVMAVIRNEHSTKCGRRRMRICERVDPPMLHDSFANAGRELIIALGKESRCWQSRF